MIRVLLNLIVFVLTVFGAPTDLVEDPPFTHNVTFTIQHGDAKTGELTMGLFGSVVPKTVANFVELSSGEHGYGYLNTTFHRIIDNFMIQGGDIEHQDGTGGYSIYGKNFNDENFIIKHDRPGRVSMANAGPNTQGSQFFITTVVTSWLDGHYVVFGQLTNGFDFLEYLQKVKSNEKTNKPLQDVVVKDIKIDSLKLDIGANSEYFEELRTREGVGGMFWLVVFSFFGIGLFVFARSRKKTLVALRSNIGFNLRAD